MAGVWCVARAVGLTSVSSWDAARPAAGRTHRFSNSAPNSVVSETVSSGTVAAELLGPGILQARTLEWAAMPSSRGSSRPRD